MYAQWRLMIGRVVYEVSCGYVLGLKELTVGISAAWLHAYIITGYLVPGCVEQDT